MKTWVAVVATLVALGMLSAAVQADMPGGHTRPPFGGGPNLAPAPKSEVRIPLEIVGAPKPATIRLAIPRKVLADLLTTAAAGNAPGFRGNNVLPPLQGMMVGISLVLGGACLVLCWMRTRPRLAVSVLSILVVGICVCSVSCIHQDRPVDPTVDVRQLPAARLTKDAVSGQAVLEVNEDSEAVRLSLAPAHLNQLADP